MANHGNVTSKFCGAVELQVFPSTFSVLATNGTIQAQQVHANTAFSSLTVALFPAFNLQLSVACSTLVIARRHGNEANTMHTVVNFGIKNLNH